MIDIIYETGDAVRPRIHQTESGIVIAHIVNDAGRWGQGFSGALASRFPEARSYYRSFGKNLELGVCQFVETVRDAKAILVVNMIAQHGIATVEERRAGKVCFQPDAFRTCLQHLANQILSRPMSLLRFRVVMPKVGSGLGGAKWEDVSAIIEQELSSQNIPVTIYTLPEEK